MLEMKNGFVITDDDCMQCRKDLGDRKFLFVQAIWTDVMSIALLPIWKI